MPSQILPVLEVDDTISPLLQGDTLEIQARSLESQIGKEWYIVYTIQSPPPNSLWFHSPKSCIKMAFANVENHLVRHAYLQIIFIRLFIYASFLPSVCLFCLFISPCVCICLLSALMFVIFIFYPLSLSFFSHFVCRCFFISCWSCPLKKENYLLDKEKKWDNTMFAPP